MKGDFSRLTFDPQRHFTRVLFQQGRPQLDADFNELSEMLLQHQRQAFVDVMGPFGTRVDADHFKVKLDIEGGELVDLTVAPGWYYVDGLRCFHHPDRGPFRHSEQPHRRSDHRLPKPPFFVYLKVWERHVTAVEQPDIREVALGPAGTDTTTRTVLVWQVLIEPQPSLHGLGLDPKMGREEVAEAWEDWAETQHSFRPGLRARALPPRNDERHAPSGYLGPENQLYRVEVHSGGAAADATFSFSRDNGSVVLPITRIAGSQVDVESLGRDSFPVLEAGAWVEIVDDALVLNGHPGPLRHIADIDLDGSSVLLTKPVGEGVSGDPHQHPLLRRWDQQETSERPGGLHLAADNAVQILEGDGDEDDWLELEDGVQIQFRPGGHYRTGDYWLIPARYSTADVVWPRDAENHPLWQSPRGIDYHYAPLARVRGLEAGELDDLRYFFGKSWFLPPPATG